MTQTLKSLFSTRFGCAPDRVEPLGASGSHRQYFRLGAGEISVIGAVGTDVAENAAFFEISSHFRSRGINVPEVYAVSEDGLCYIQEDLGDETLFSRMLSARACGVYSEADRALLLEVMRQLPRIQIAGGEGLDFSKCYPAAEMDRRSVMFDLNYFKYCFLKPAGIEFNEILLEDDFESLCADLLDEDWPQPLRKAFLYRDFQSRNVMMRGDRPWFIDFQGGRRGPVWYDLASFVWQARAAYPESLREEMVDAYIQSLREYVDFDEAEFRDRLGLFVLFRTLQVLGAYGFRGLVEKKRHFVDSIPYAMSNLRGILPIRYPYLNAVLEHVLSTASEAEYSVPADGRLHIDVTSFSYKKGIPEDRTANGGGYVFDCRGMENPGRYKEYANLTGLDRPVIDFLEERGEMAAFLEKVYGIVDAHAACFIARGFTHLNVCFGCTGGQHRSVYSAEHVAAHLKEKFGDRVAVHLCHRERSIEL